VYNNLALHSTDTTCGVELIAMLLYFVAILLLYFCCNNAIRKKKILTRVGTRLKKSTETSKILNYTLTINKNSLLCLTYKTITQKGYIVKIFNVLLWFNIVHSQALPSTFFI